MKIVHLIDYIQPQLGYQEYFLAHEHARMGHEVTVVASDRYYPFPNYDSTVYPILGERMVGAGQWECDGFTIIRLRTLLELGTKTWLRGLHSTIKKLCPDLVICHGIISFNAPRVADLKKKLGFRLVCDDHVLMCSTKRGLAGALFYRLFNPKKVLRSADRIVAVADECVQVVVEKYGFPRDAVEMIPLGADTERFKFRQELRGRFRGEHGISEKAVVVAHAGKLMARKGPHNILAAVERLSGRLNGDLVLLFVGNMADEYASTFQRHQRRVERLARIIRLPAVRNEDLVAIYSGSDLAVWPKQGSASMIEAASCGLPIICCDYLTERYKNDNGIPVKEDDIDALAEALFRLVTNEPLRRAMGARGRELVVKELSWRSIAERFLA